MIIALSFHAQNSFGVMASVLWIIILICNPSPTQSIHSYSLTSDLFWGMGLFNAHMHAHIIRLVRIAYSMTTDLSWRRGLSNSHKLTYM